MRLKVILLVALCGGLGSVLRFVLTTLVQRRMGGSFPGGTLAVNVVGSMVIGAVMVVYAARSALESDARFALTAGLLGGFTTYSAFSYETLALLENRSFVRAGLYVAMTLVLCLGACALGSALAKLVTR